MRFEGSLRIEIFFFGKCIGQEQGEGYPGQEEDTMKKVTSAFKIRAHPKTSASRALCVPLYVD